MRKHIITQALEAFKKLEKNNDLACVHILSANYYINCYVQLDGDVEDWLLSIVDGPIVSNNKIFLEQELFSTTPQLMTDEQYLTNALSSQLDRLLACDDTAEVLVL